jgi:hypothetical protein
MREDFSDHAAIESTVTVTIAIMTHDIARGTSESAGVIYPSFPCVSDRQLKAGARETLRPGLTRRPGGPGPHCGGNRDVMTRDSVGHWHHPSHEFESAGPGHFNLKRVSLAAECQCRGRRRLDLTRKPEEPQ